MNDDKIKASVLLKELLLITETALFEEDKQLFEKLEDNQKKYDNFKDMIPLNLDSCFTFEQVCELNKLLSEVISLGCVNANTIVDCHRLAYIRSTILLLIKHNFIIDDVYIDSIDTYKKLVLELLPECKYFN